MSYSASQETLFSLLPKARTPWTEFAFSTGTQAMVIVFLAWVRLLYPRVVSPPEHTFRSVQLVSTPVPVNHRPQPLPDLPKPTLVARLETPNTALRLPAPHPKAPPKVEHVTAPPIPIPPNNFNPLPLTPPPPLS